MTVYKMINAMHFGRIGGDLDAEESPHTVAAYHVVLASFTMFVVAALGVIVPYVFYKQSSAMRKIFGYVNAFAGGSLLGFALFHLLPESLLMLEHEGFGITNEESFFNHAYLFATFTFLLIFSTEYIFGVDKHENLPKETDSTRSCQSVPHADPSDPENHDTAKSEEGDSEGVVRSPPSDRSASASPKTSGLVFSFSALLAVALLSFHSFFEGLVVGVAESATVMWVATITILLHKWAAGFALATVLMNKVSSCHYWMYLGAFCLASPIGALVGLGFQTTGWVVIGVVNAICTGVLLHVAMHIIFQLDAASRCDRILQSGLIIVGAAVIYGLMVLHVATAVHDH